MGIWGMSVNWSDQRRLPCRQAPPVDPTFLRGIGPWQDFRGFVSFIDVFLFLILKDVTYGCHLPGHQEISPLLSPWAQTVPVSPMWLIVILCRSQNNAYCGLPVAKALGTLHRNQRMMGFFGLLVWLVGFGSVMAGLSSSQWKAPDYDRRISLWAKFCWEISVWRVTSYYWLLAGGFQPLLLYISLGILTENAWMMEAHRATLSLQSWSEWQSWSGQECQEKPISWVLFRDCQARKETSISNPCLLRSYPVEDSLEFPWWGNIWDQARPCTSQELLKSDALWISQVEIGAVQESGLYMSTRMLPSPFRFGLKWRLGLPRMDLFSNLQWGWMSNFGEVECGILWSGWGESTWLGSVLGLDSQV